MERKPMKDLIFRNRFAYFGLLLGLVAAVGLFTISGCTPHNDPAIMSSNKSVLAGNGEEVGVLPDGRKLVRYRLSMGSNIRYHWVYIVDNTITINRTESHCKTSSNHVDVIIDGVTYKPVVENQ